MLKLSPNKLLILRELASKWGEYIEMEENDDLIIQILLNTIESQQAKIEYLTKIESEYYRGQRNGTAD